MDKQTTYLVSSIIILLGRIGSRRRLGSRRTGRTVRPAITRPGRVPRPRRTGRVVPVVRILPRGRRTLRAVRAGRRSTGIAGIRGVAGPGRGRAIRDRRVRRILLWRGAGTGPGIVAVAPGSRVVGRPGRGAGGIRRVRATGKGASSARLTGRTVVKRIWHIYVVGCPACRARTARCHTAQVVGPTRTYKQLKIVLDLYLPKNTY